MEADDVGFNPDMSRKAARDIINARRHFNLETPQWIHDIADGKVKKKDAPTVPAWRDLGSFGS